jgi:hypothetical protein
VRSLLSYFSGLLESWIPNSRGQLGVLQVSNLSRYLPQFGRKTRFAIHFFQLSEYSHESFSG